MGWWSSILAERAKAFTVAALHTGSTPAPNRAYVTVWLQQLQIPYLRRGDQRLYGTLTSTYSLVHEGGGKAEITAVINPAQLQGFNPRDAGRVIIGTQLLYGPVPYRGGPFEIEVALFSVPGGSLTGPYLEVLSSLAGAAGLSFVSVAAPFAAPLAKGLSLLLSGTDAKALEIGYKAAWTGPQIGTYAVVAVGEQTAKARGLRLSGGAPVWADGQPVQEAFLIFTVDAAANRYDFADIPGVKEAWQELQFEARRGDVPRAHDALAVLRRQATFSADLITEDAQSIVQRAEERLRLAIPAAGTRAATGTFSALAEAGVYDTPQTPLTAPPVPDGPLTVLPATA